MPHPKVEGDAGWSEPIKYITKKWVNNSINLSNIQTFGQPCILKNPYIDFNFYRLIDSIKSNLIHFVSKTTPLSSFFSSEIHISREHILE